MVRTYPVPAKQGVEVSCTAAITDASEWLRLFPIPYRFLDPDQRFAKYQWIEVEVTKPRKDVRPESYKIENNSIRLLGAPLSSERGWKARKDVVLPLQAHCLCCLKAERDIKGSPTLGLFRPKSIERLIIKEMEPTWTDDEQRILSQDTLFQSGPREKLEKVPYKFTYQFTCDHHSCPGHNLSCTDWEMGAAWRKWRDEYGDEWEGKFRQKFEAEMIEKFDTHFFVGTVHGNPKSWIIVGLFYPPRLAPTPLFDL